MYYTWWILYNMNICPQLFDDLEVCGKSITKPQKSADSTSAVDNIDRCSPGGDAASQEIVLEEENWY